MPDKSKGVQPKKPEQTIVIEEEDLFEDFALENGG